jgi:hypothetical protein
MTAAPFVLSADHRLGTLTLRRGALGPVLTNMVLDECER